jgi:7-keto-8-aminopelargonate synthetase-like enzyme
MAEFISKIEMVDEMIEHAKSFGVMQKVANNFSTKDGKTILVDGKNVTYFGNCSYLGLDHDQRIKDAAKEAIDRYGIMLATSRSFARLGMYEEVEDLLGQIFEKPTISIPTTTLGHMSAIPTLVGEKDAVILDQQVHTSVSNAVSFSKSRGTYVEMVRHNRLDILEERIKKLRLKHDRIWYMVDGVYSMFGDVAPLKELYELMEKYDEFYLYVDDSHGMSWAGKNGQGFALSQLPAFHDKMILMASLCKGFGVSGAAMVFPNEKMKNLVLNVGPTLMFSAPIQSSTLGAIIASAKIHLTDEIYDLQERLKDRMRYFMMNIVGMGLPAYSDGKTPVAFIGIGVPQRVGEVCAYMLNKGYLLNPCSYPSVPYNKGGLRATININLTNEDIYEMLSTLSEHLKIDNNPMDISNKNSEKLTALS